MALRMYRTTTVGSAASAQSATAYSIINAATDRSLDLKTIKEGTNITIDDDGAGNLTFNAAASGAAAITSGTIAGTTMSNNINANCVRTSAAVTANATVTYADVTGLTQTVVAGATYRFRLVLPSTVASATGGIKYSFHYTNSATLTSIEATGIGYTSAAVAVQHTTTATDNADLFSQAAVVIMTIIEGTFVVNAGGTVTVQMAQNTSNASNSVALVGGTFTLERLA